MKDLEKNQTDTVEVDESETKFDLDEALVDEPVLEQDYFTFNIQDIIKAVNEHEAAETGPDSETEETVPVESETGPESELESEPEPELESEPEPETTQEPVIELPDEPEPEPEPETEETMPVEPEPELEPEPEPVDELEPVPEEPADEPEIETGDEPAQEPVTESEFKPEFEPEESGVEPVTESEPEPEENVLQATVKNKSNKKLIIAVVILLLIIVGSIGAGLAAANSLVDKANAAKDEKIAAVQENIKTVKLSESLRAHAADEVLEDMQVPTYTLEELYALDLREKTGFTVEDLEIITTRGLVGCEEAFVKAEETYGVNSIFLISIASLESAYGTQMFRPNNMFGYGRTGFSSKSECIMTVASGLGGRYLNPSGSLYGGSPTLKGVNKRYAANPQWYYKVGSYMQRYYNELAAAKNGNLEKFE